MKATSTRIEVEISMTELSEFIKEKTGVDVSEMTIDDYTCSPSEDIVIFDFT